MDSCRGRIGRYGASLLAVMLLGSLGAVAQDRDKKDPPAVVNDPKKTIEQLQNAPATAAAPVDPKTYKLGPEDVITVKVWKENDLSGMLMVRPDGKISMPLIGELQAAGRTPLELTADLTEALTKLINKPEVFVAVTQVNSRKYYMTGEIKKPGPYPLITSVTVLEAISSAGGLTEAANPKTLVIVRGKERLKFNYKEVMAGKKLEQNVEVQNGDHIFVH